MPLLTEEQALGHTTILSSGEKMDSYNRGVMVGELTDYYSNQEARGEATFPNYERKEQKQKRAHYSDMFSSIERTSEMAGDSFSEIDKYSSEPDDDKAKAAILSYMGETSGGLSDELIASNYDTFKNDWATQILKRPISDVSNTELFSMLGEQFKSENQISELKTQAQTTANQDAFKAAMGQGLSEDSRQKFEDSLPDDLPEGVRDELIEGRTLMFKRSLAAQKAFAPHAIKIAEGFKAMSEQHQGDDVGKRSVAVDAVADLLGEYEDHPDFKPIMGMAIRAAHADESGDLEEFAKSLERSLGRMGEDAAGIYDSIKSTSLRQDDIKVPKGFKATTIEEAQDQMSGVGLQRNATPKEKILLGRLADKIDKRRRSLSMVMDIFNEEIDPITAETWVGDMAYGFAELVPQVAIGMVAAAATGGTALVGGAAATAVQFPLIWGSRNRQFLKEGRSVEEALWMSAASATAEAPMEALSNLVVIGKLPLVNKLITSWGGHFGVRGFATRAGAYGAANLVIENGVEGAQDITPLFVQELAAALDKDIPGPDWAKGLEEWKGARWGTFLAMFPLNLLGIGGSMMSQEARMELAKQRGGDVAGLRAWSGMTEKDGQKIADEQNLMIRADMIDAVVVDHKKALAYAKEISITVKDSDVVESPEINTIPDAEGGGYEVNFPDGSPSERFQGKNAMMAAITAGGNWSEQKALEPKAEPVIEGTAPTAEAQPATEAKPFDPEQIQEAFPGSKVQDLPEGKGWKVELPGGREINVEVNEAIPVDIPTVMRDYNITRAEAESRTAEGVPGVMVPKGVKLKLSDGQVLTPEDVMVLVDPKRANDTTARHEALHVARELGLFDDKEGAKIWQSLLDEHGSEENVAAARELWEGKTGLWNKVRQFVFKTMSKLGLGISSDVAMNETFSKEFWSKPEAGATGKGVQYQIRAKPPTFPITSLKNDVVDELRESMGKEGLEGLATETHQQALDHATATLAADPRAGDTLVAGLIQNGRVLNPREHALLVLHHRKVYNSFEKVSDELFEANRKGDAVASAIAHSSALILNKEIDIVEEAARKSGSAAGSALNIRKISLRNDFSLEGLVRKARVAQAGKPLSLAQTSELKAIADKLKAESQAFEAKLEASELKASGLEKKLDELLAKEVKEHAPKPKPKAKKAGKPSPKSKKENALAALKAAWTAGGHSFTDDVKPSPKGKGVKYQIGGSKSSQQEAQEDTPELRAAASQMAEVFMEDGATSFAEFWAQARLHLGPDASKAEGVFRDAWTEIESSPDFVPTDVDTSDVGAVTREARAIQRRLVEAGLRDRDQIVSLVQEAMPEVLPTNRDVMEALSGYGQFKAPSKLETDQLIRDHNAQLLQLTKLAELKEAKVMAEKLRKEGLSDDVILEKLEEADLNLKATGMLRDTPSDIVRHLTAEVNELKKQMPVSSEGKEGQLQTAHQARDRMLTNRRNDLKAELKAKEQNLKTKTNLKDTPESIKLRDEIADLMIEHRAMFPPRGATEEQKDAHALKSIERAVKEVSRQIKEGDIDAKKGAAKRSTPEIEVERAKLEALKAERQVLRDIKDPKLTPEEKAIRQYEANLRRRIADYQAFIEKGDFSPVEKKEPRTLSKSERILKRKLEETKAKAIKKMGEYHLANLNPLEKGYDLAKETAYLSRALMTSIDASALGRQGGLAGLAHPHLAQKAAIEMLKAMASKQGSFDSMEAIKSHPQGQFALTAKLSLTDESGPITRQEESIHGRWAQHIPLVAGSGRGFTTFLNNLRFDLFNQMTENLGRSGRVTLDEAKVIARYINVATGRADFKSLNESAAAFSAVFFAPRWVASRFQYIAMPLYLPFTKTSLRVKKAIAVEYARTLIGMSTFIGSLMAFAYLMADDDWEIPTLSFDWTSPDFLKPKIGETRIDPTAGLSSAAVFLGRMLQGETTSPVTGRVKDLSEGGYNQPTYASVAIKYARTKAGPIPGAIWTAGSRMENVVGERETAGSLALSLISPLSFGEVGSTMEARGLTKGSAISTLALFGASTGTYGPRTEYLAGTPEEREALVKKHLKTVRWNDNPIAYGSLLTPEQLKKFDGARKRNALSLKAKLYKPMPSGEAEQEKWRKNLEKTKKALVGHPYLSEYKLKKENK